MKAITTYVCEKCGTEFCSAESALRCEHSHPDMCEMTVLNYDKMYKGLPLKIKVTFDNGSTVLYTRHYD